MTTHIFGTITNQTKGSILYDNVLSYNTGATSSDGDNIPQNAVSGTTYDYWKPTASNHVIYGDYGSAITCDMAGIAAHSAAGMLVQVVYGSTGTSWAVAASFTPSGLESDCVLFPPKSARFWGIRVSGIASIGVASVGKRLIMPTGVIGPHVALHNASEYELLHNSSIRGEWLGNMIVRQGGKTTCNFGRVRREFFEVDMRDFKTHYDEGKPFFLCNNPFSSPDDMGYCWRTPSSTSLTGEQVDGIMHSMVSLNVSKYARVA